ncbi:hypothetical protein AB0B04_18500, partial [Streptomyces xinghaiensis]
YFFYFRRTTEIYKSCLKNFPFTSHFRSGDSVLRTSQRRRQAAEAALRTAQAKAVLRTGVLRCAQNGPLCCAPGPAFACWVPLLSWRLRESWGAVTAGPTGGVGAVVAFCHGRGWGRLADGLSGGVSVDLDY